jgi:hypothetical protein
MRSRRDSRPRPPRTVAPKIESRAARRRRAISEIHEASNTAALSAGLAVERLAEGGSNLEPLGGAGAAVELAGAMLAVLALDPRRSC